MISFVPFAMHNGKGAFNLSEDSQMINSADNTIPVEPNSRYRYDNAFNYYDNYLDSNNLYYGQLSLSGIGTEWSQDTSDLEKLQLNFMGIVLPWKDFMMEERMFVKSSNVFEKQSDPKLGAYIDWKIDIDFPYVDSVNIETYIISLYILKPTGANELIIIENSNPQQGSFYLANFSKYIWDDGKVRFMLRGAVAGNSIDWGGIVMSIKFEGLRIAQEIITPDSDESQRTLILVHGFKFFRYYEWGDVPFDPSFWETYLTSLEYIYAYDNIIVISYYGYFTAYRFAKDSTGKLVPIGTDVLPVFMNCYTLIEDIASELALYIMYYYSYISDNVDIVCHSMGGLVTRFMIKYFYVDIQNFYTALGRNFIINNVCTIATPNHGIWYSALLGAFAFCAQGIEMGDKSPFILLLNYNPEIFPLEIPPSGLLIHWFTYRSGLYTYESLLLEVRYDGIVETDSVPLIGAINKGLYPFDHTQLIGSQAVCNVVFNDINKPPDFVKDLFNRNIPGEYMELDDLILEPNYNSLGGETIMSIDLLLDDIVNLDPTSVYININPTYQLTLKQDTIGTYETILPLPDGWYSYLMIADGFDGKDYYFMGNLRIVDDDVRPPGFFFMPFDLKVSDEEAIGGFTVGWSISDYSGIDLGSAFIYLTSQDPPILLDHRIYEETEGQIDDGYIFSNEPAEYLISLDAWDNDNDPGHEPPEEDSLNNHLDLKVTIYDDDTNEPDILFYIIEKNWVNDQIYLRFLVNALDESGISLVDVNLGSYHSERLGEHEVLLTPGIYDLHISVTDGDNDRFNDALTAILDRVLDLQPPHTCISFGNPNITIGDTIHITPDTFIRLKVDDNMVSTWFQISNDTFTSGWIQYFDEFYLNSPDFFEGRYIIEFYSKDLDSNSELINSIIIALDKKAPLLEILNPYPDDALQDGVTFVINVRDLTGVDWVNISIREPYGIDGIMIDPAFEDIPATYIGDYNWQLTFDTTLLPDGYYLLFVETSDSFNFYSSDTVEFSIRNWAVLELLPATTKNKAGRTMPVKFSLRVAEAVDEDMPFVWNEELDIFIYDKSNPGEILQHSKFGDTSVDYRISSENELYITNFKTLKTAAVYVVEIWRKEMKIGFFEFETYK